MPAIAARFERTSVPGRGVSIRATEGILRALRAALDRLVPPADDASPDRDLPPEWFKYPPI
jgi:hypothetical protein